MDEIKIQNLTIDCKASVSNFLSLSHLIFAFWHNDKPETKYAFQSTMNYRSRSNSRRRISIAGFFSLSFSYFSSGVKANFLAVASLMVIFNFMK